MKKLFIIITIISIATPILAQGGPPSTPIDGGLSLLLAAGGAYGIKRFSNKKK